MVGPVRFEEEYRLTARQGTTEFTQSIKAWPRGPFRLVWPLIARQLESLIPADLGRLKQLAEDTMAATNAERPARDANPRGLRIYSRQG